MKQTRPARRTAASVIGSAALSLALAGGLLVPAAQPASAAPTLRVQRVVGGLTIPWDVTWIGQTMLYNERPGRVWTKRPGAAPQRVNLALPRVWARSEGGLLGLVADPGAASNGYFYSCMSVAASATRPKDVEVWKWKLTSPTTATRVRTMVSGLPIGSGRHNGCRMVIRGNDLFIGTGDAAQGANPQNLGSLGGKILRVRLDGSIPTDNPFYRRGGNARYVWTYGHRNVQGLALRPYWGSLYSVEHGPDRDDEINRVAPGANYGWSPTPGYNESRPMTDLTRFPRAKRAAWRSGAPTLATSGATFLSGSAWGSWNGRLAVALLKGQGVQLFTVSTTADVATKREKVLTSYGRIRSVHQGPDGALYFTTSNGSNDGIYRVAAG